MPTAETYASIASRNYQRRYFYQQRGKPVREEDYGMKLTLNYNCEAKKCRPNPFQMTE